MRLVLLFILVTVLAGCASARRDEPIGAPLSLDSAQLIRGQKSFMFYCNKCHPGGEAGVGFALNNKPVPGVLIKLKVRTRSGSMPPFSQSFLTEEQLDDIVVYLKALRKQPQAAGK